MTRKKPLLSDHLSYELHRLTLQKAQADWPHALEIARANIDAMRNSSSADEQSLRRLKSLLQEGPDVCAIVLLGSTSRSQALRACDVFGGLLTDEQRHAAATRLSDN